ncbi:MAG: hypothetical protein ABIB11_04355 [Candidatus Omnitrophota bacterium]
MDNNKNLPDKKAKIELVEEPEAKVLGVYPIEVREKFERMTSKDALYLEPIPGYEQRWLNRKAREKTGRNSLYIPQKNAEARAVGDLVPGFAPTDLVKKHRKALHEKGVGRLKKEEEIRRYEAEKLHRDSGGRVQIQVHHSSQETKPQFNERRKTYFYGK